MSNRLLRLVICIIGTISLATPVLAQCKYVDPHDRNGFYAWCRCIGGFPHERNGNSVCDKPDNAPPDPVAQIKNEYSSRRHQAWQTLHNFYYSHDSYAETALRDQAYAILNNLPDNRSINSLDDAYAAADELAGYFDGYLAAYERQRKQIQELNEQTDALEKVKQEMLDSLSRWGVTQDSNANASLLAKLQAQGDDLAAKISSMQQPLEAEDQFNRRILSEKHVVAKRVLERIHAPLPYWATDKGQYAVLSPLESRHAHFKEALKCLGGFTLYPGCYDYPDPLIIGNKDPHCVEHLDNCFVSGHPALPALKPSIERQSVQSVTEDNVRGRLKDIDPSPLLDYLRTSYPPYEYGGSPAQSANRRFENVSQAAESVGVNYRKFRPLVVRIGTAESRIGVASIEISREDHEISAKSLTDTALWWHFDHLTFVLLQKTGSGDPDAISRLREVGDEIIRFSNDELELTQRTVAALASGNTSELQSIQNLMQEKLCDFRRNVDNKAFPLPDKYRFFFPEQISCS
jgi:hypothetical protein